MLIELIFSIIIVLIFLVFLLSPSDKRTGENEDINMLFLDDGFEEIETLKRKIETLEENNSRTKKETEDIIKKAMDEYAGIVDKKAKREILAELFGKSQGDYARHEEFEKQRFHEKVKKKEEELVNRELQQGLHEKLFEQDKKIQEQEQKASSDREVIRNEMRIGFLDLNYKHLHLEKGITSLKGFVTEKFAQVEINFHKTLSALQEHLANLKVEIKQDVADIKVQFGKEMVRIDKQQLQIIAKMQEYENQVKAFSTDIIKVKLEAEKFAIRGEDLLNRANTVHQRHKAEMHVMSKDLEVGLRHISLHKDDFANKVAQSKLILDQITQDQYFALKDMAYERIGINMLRQEYEQKINLEQQKIQNLITKQQHLEERIRTAISHGREVASLRHQLYVTEENLQFIRNRASLMQQEFGILRRLSR